MPLANLIPIKPNLRLMRHAGLWSAIAVVMCALSVLVISVRPFNYGIDFEEGVSVDVRTKGRADVEQMRARLAFLSPQIQTASAAGDVVSIHVRKLEDGAKAIADIKDALGGEVEYLSAQFVGPKVGAEFKTSAFWAVVSAILAMSVYIGLRFQLPMAVGSVLSLTHDVLIALMVLNLGGYEFGLTTLAALLTLAGYSINDTVVIYDRMRENMKKYRGRDLAEVIDTSINETLSRTILTGLTTLLAVGAIYIFGGEVLRGFSAVMMFGIAIGAYSSVFLSTSTLLLFKKRFG